jgi:hypothetical protein
MSDETFSLSIEAPGRVSHCKTPRQGRRITYGAALATSAAQSP